jgi:RNA polymerase sigma-70 factor (ECF subfamily)
VARSDPRDDVLAAGIREGDEEAFADAFRAHVTPLVRYARRFVPTEAAAQDVVMDVFLRLWRDRASMPSDIRLGAYLNVAVRNAALNAAAHRDVELACQRRGAAEGWSPAMSAPALEPDEELERSEAKEELRRAYLTLPTRLRQVMEMRWFEGRSYQEIARELQLSAKSVDNYLAKGMRLLREVLARRRDG